MILFNDDEVSLNRMRFFSNRVTRWLLYRLRPAPLQPPSCATVSKTCGLINSTSGIFSSCTSQLSQSLVNDMTDMCNMDACFTKNASVCLSIKAFVDYCAFIGAQIPCETWMSASGCGKITYFVDNFGFAGSKYSSACWTVIVLTSHWIAHYKTLYIQLHALESWHNQTYLLNDEFRDTLIHN
jgi:C8 domain